MLLKKRVKGGVLIYALLMSAIFSLLLQFYLSRLVASQQQIMVMEAANKAYMMAHLTKTAASEMTGQLAFSEGSSHYERGKNNLSVTVTLKSGQAFTYQFPSHRSTIKKETAPNQSQRQTTLDARLPSPEQDQQELNRILKQTMDKEPAVTASSTKTD